ncbi:Serine protease [Phytophthora cinnamomi]|uniref:Serine protease n=1 Tax=Phytophthora cinnamomi TaxID=4785 RepID=UPI00355AA07E|nr:Serine protease [Phytophthora cinnamomi]
MASAQENSLRPLVAAEGITSLRHIDALDATSKHFGPNAKKKAALSTGITVEYVIHENETKADNAPEERVLLIMGFMCAKEAWAPLIDMLLH